VSAIWPTHKAKANARRKQQLAKAKRRQHYRRIENSGKRGVKKNDA